MDNAKVNVLRKAINGALEAVGTQHDVNIELGSSLSYTNTGVSGKINITETAVASKAGVDKEFAKYVADFYKNRHKLTTLKEEHLGKKFMLLGKGISMTFVGMTPQGSAKAPCVGVTAKGDRYRISEHNVVHGMHNCLLNDPVVEVL